MLPGNNPFLLGALTPGQQALLPGQDPSSYYRGGPGGGSAAGPAGGPAVVKPLATTGPKKSGAFRKTGALKVTGATRKARRITQNWYWPDADQEEENREGVLTPQVMVYTLNQPIGLLGSEADRRTEGALAKAFQDYEISEKKAATEKFAIVAEELSGKDFSSDAEARAGLERLASSLEIRAISRELVELAPRVAHLLKANRDLIRDFIGLCQTLDTGCVSPEAVTKFFEQLNRLYDAPVLPARRDLAVEHLLWATTTTRSLGAGAILNRIQLCQHILLSRYPAQAAELLLAILSSTRVNTEELGIRAFKFDQARAKNIVRVLKDALEPEPEMRRRENISKQNYFSHLFSSVAINAVLQANDPAARYARRRGLARTYHVREEEVKKGVFRVVSSPTEDFCGLSYDEMAWVNRQFAGQSFSGYLPERLSY